MLLYVCNLQLESDVTHYKSLFTTNINICVYINPDILQLHPEFNSKEYPNVLFMPMPELSEFNIVKHFDSHLNQVHLPEHRNQSKDTYDYILFSHIKYELLTKTIDMYKKDYPQIELTHIAWIENSMLYTFLESETVWTNEVCPLLSWYSSSYLRDQFIALPGCNGWSPIQTSNIDILGKEVYWRFCGGFMIGDCKTMQDFCLVYYNHLITFINDFEILTWDFNLLSFVEYLQKFENDKLPIYKYNANHNYTILHISADLFTRPLKSSCQVEYTYPEFDTFYPSSASYTVDANQKHWLNTRYVNYWIYPNGYYLFHNPTRKIENKNVLSELDPHTLCPMSYIELNTNDVLPSVNKKHYISVGLEDIRLFQHNQKTHYVATTFEYSNDDSGKIITGVYNTDTCTVEENVLIESPSHQTIEKNWVPIQDNLFMYKWSPLTIGEMCVETHQLKIVKEIENKHPIFKHVRGSAPFISTDTGYLAVVHYSEEHSPRHYYHMMVLINKETYEIIRFSKTFCFECLGIEFCIGFTTKDSNYVFWISRHDRNPVQLIIPFTEIDW